MCFNNLKHCYSPALAATHVDFLQRWSNSQPLRAPGGQGNPCRISYRFFHQCCCITSPQKGRRWRGGQEIDYKMDEGGN